MPKAREFGDAMAKEGKTSQIPFIIILMYGSIALYSYACGLWITGDAFYTQILFYFANLVAFYIWHYMAHQKWSKEMYTIHMEHHMKNFPPNAFYGKEKDTIERLYGAKTPTFLQLMDPRTSTNFTWKHEGPLFVFDGIIIVAAYFMGYSIASIGCALFLGIVMGTVGSALHSSFHVRNFQLEKYSWYMELRTLHYIHHLGSMKHNYAVLNLGLDGFFSSLAVEDPVKAKDREKALKTIPDGISKEDLDTALNQAGAPSLLFFNIEPSFRNNSSAIKRGYPTVLLRCILVFLSLWVWYNIEPTLQAPPVLQEENYFPINDLGFQWVLPIREYILQSAHKDAIILYLCGANIIILELSVIAAFLSSILGSTVRVTFSGLLALTLRQALLQLNTIPKSPNALWNSPQGFLFSMFKVERTNTFLCISVLFITVAAIEWLRVTSSWRSLTRIFTRAAALCIMASFIGLHLVLQTSFSLEIGFAILVAIYASMLGANFAPKIDQFIP